MCVFGFGLTSRLWSPCSVAKAVRLNDDRLQFPPIKSLWHPRPLACNDPFSTNLLAKNVLKLMNYYLGTLHVLSPRVGCLNKGTHAVGRIRFRQFSRIPPTVGRCICKLTKVTAWTGIGKTGRTLGPCGCWTFTRRWWCPGQTAPWTIVTTGWCIYG